MEQQYNQSLAWRLLKRACLRRSLLLISALLFCAVVRAQITSVHGTVSDDLGTLVGATVVEIDGSGRIINSAITDMNGNFNMPIKSTSNKIRFSYVGLKTQTMPINKTTYAVTLVSATQLKEVTVTARRRGDGNNLAVPEREISYASQKLDMKSLEGLGITSIDEALQGRIAGLDIIGNSGDLGAGSTLRLRGASSLSSLTDSNPLIVVDGNIRSVDMSNFDLAGANDEKFAELLNINPEDIASINVLKDAAATAVYGSQGGSGVIEITTKRGARGKPRVSYSVKLTGTHQPKGYKLLDGDDYTMMLKESYFNPQQDDNSSQSIAEINYDPTFAEYHNYNDNTDWRDAVTQWGFRQNHYLSVAGGGEKASFRVGGGFDHETGTMIEQKLNRFSTRVALDYYVSERIKVSTNFALTYTKNYMNSDNLLDIAMRKMPNMSIYEEDANGNDTDRYYEMLQSASSVFDKNQKSLVNPVASAHLAKKTRRTYDLAPELVLNYYLLGMDDEHTQLNWRGSVYMSVFNQYDDSFYPRELSTLPWSDNVNTAGSSSSKSVAFNTKQTLTLIPAFRNKDHSMMMMGRFELNSGHSSGQSNGARGLPGQGIESPDAGGINTGLGSSYSEWRSLYFTYSLHYAYKSRYMFDFSMRADGTTKFGPGHRWGFFPAVSLRWNVVDEPFMKWFRDNAGLTMLSVRPSWGRVGNQPNRDYLYVSKYVTGDRYIDNQSMRIDNIRLTNLQWQINNSYNLGIDLGLWDRFNLTFEVYSTTTSNLLLQNYRIPSNTGFMTIPYKNGGKLRNTGWEFHINTNKLLKINKFTFDMNANFGNNRNEILEMDEYVLNSLNSTFNYNNAVTLQRVQLHNPFGAIYGFRYKGVYQYNFDTFKNMNADERAAFLAAGHTAPVAFNAEGGLILDANGNPIRMRYNYTPDGTTGKNYAFTGGDAIYEDVNHDGNIDALDIVYLGSSLPKLTGGFGFTFQLKDWRLTTQFTYRVGNKIINMARLNAEAMIGNDNQSQAVNYRWRKEGDVTSIPRAMFGSESNYNTLISDRFVESGTYLRMSYVQLSYAIAKKYLKWIGLNRVSLYASANNPFVLTHYTGVDPDISQSGYGPAVDNSKTPRSRSFTFGLTVDF